MSVLTDAVVMTTMTAACHYEPVLPLSSDAFRLTPSRTTTSSRPTLP